MQRLAFVLAIAAVTAGCTTSPPTVAPTAVEPGPALEGWVLDAASLPLEGASLNVQGSNESASAGPDGHYAFGTLPVDASLIIVAEARGHVPASKTVTLQEESTLLLNFTLVAVPTKTPHVEVLDLRALIGCQSNAVIADEEHPFDCGDAAGPNNKPSIDFAVGPDTAGVVVEVQWTPSTPAAEQLKATLETTGYGDQDALLDEKAGRSVLRMQVNSLQASRYYAQGGHLTITVAAGADPDEDESQAAASAAMQQSVQLLVSTFYVDPPPPTYTAVQ